ncbi:MAG: TolC family protein [Blastocatellia bacterium]
MTRIISRFFHLAWIVLLVCACQAIVRAQQDDRGPRAADPPYLQDQNLIRNLTPRLLDTLPGFSRPADLNVAPQSGRQPAASSLPPPAASGAPLMLDDVLRQVELNHPKLLGADAERRVATAKRLEKQGAFDPAVFYDADYLRYNSASRRGSLLSTRGNDVGVEWLTRYGVKLYGGARLNFGTVKSPLSSTGETGEYFFGVKIPFMRGARINEKSAGERQALLGEPLADQELVMRRLEIQLKAANAYWDWVAAKRKRDVAASLLELARTRLDAVRKRADAGDLPPIDIVEADQETQRRQGGLIKADRDLQKSAFKLGLYLWEQNGAPAPLPVAGNVPVNDPAPVLYTDERAIEGEKLALERRPEIKMVNINRDIVQVDLDLGRNQRLPQVDLGFSPGRDTGAGGVGNTLKAELTVSLPLRQRTADGRIGAATLKLQKLDFELINQRQTIVVEIADAISAINTTYARYNAARAEVELARRLEEGERKRFSLGDSTLFLVNQRERATAEAENKLIEIQAEYEQAVAGFRAATGSFRP